MQLFKAPEHKFDLDENAFMGWHREGAKKVSILPLLKQLFEPRHERATWLNFLPAHKPRWSKPKFRFARFNHDFDFKHGGKWRHQDWSKCHEVPLPAAWPLFSLALLSLGLFKKRR